MTHTFATPLSTANIKLLRTVIAAIGRKHKSHRGQKGGKPRNNNWRDNIGSFFKMGQEGSSPIDESVPPKTLASRTLAALAEYINSGDAQRIVVMSGVRLGYN